MFPSNYLPYIIELEIRPRFGDRRTPTENCRNPGYLSNPHFPPPMSCLPIRWNFRDK